MSSILLQRTLRTLSALVLFFCAYNPASSQYDYKITQYTSKEGLPQNSIRGLAFDTHGFLWIATEGGIARFDGNSFRVFGPEDLPGLNNQRFTQALICTDTSIIFIDHLNSMYGLSRDSFYRIPNLEYTIPDKKRFWGSPPDAFFMAKDSVFVEEMKGVHKMGLPDEGVLHAGGHTYYILSDRISLFDIQTSKIKVIRPHRFESDKYAAIDGDLLHFASGPQLTRYQPNTNTFESCNLTYENGESCQLSFAKAALFQQFPFEDLYIVNDNKLFRLWPAKDQRHYMISVVLDQLPDNCKINSVAYQKKDDVLFLGTDSRGLFVYKRKNFSSYIFALPGLTVTNSYYAQGLKNQNTLLASNGLEIDIATMTSSKIFPYFGTSFLMCSDDSGTLYYAHSGYLHRYNDQQPEKQITIRGAPHTPTCLKYLDGTIWVGTTNDVDYISEDSLVQICEIPYRGQGYGISCMDFDADHHLWFGSYFQLYRYDLQTHQLDSFPILENGAYRSIEFINGKLFIGTYGNGYYIYHKDQFVRMPTGRNGELSHVHTFVKDATEHLWISTNRGLYKTHLEVVDAFLKDTTLLLDYYAYLEEDGMQSTEFNGGCSPAHLWLPDGRLSFPSIEGLVMCVPEDVPDYFPQDSVLIEYLMVDGLKYHPDKSFLIPANHTNITVQFASACWNRPYNQYIYYKIEGLHTAFRLSAIGENSHIIGHLKPGQYTFVLKRRSGLLPEDFIYSRLHFTVQNPWYANTWAYILYGIGFIVSVWAVSKLYTRSIKQRNIDLQKKVAVQTSELLQTNNVLEINLSKLERTELNLRENLRVRDRLISIITHDILTPLRFIGQIARLGGEDKPGEDGLAKRALTDVQNAVYKLFHSTQNLLHWVTYQQEQFKTSSTNCSPFALVEQLMEDFREMSHYQGNILVNEVPEDDVILTDPRILNIVLHNLLSNAIKYTKSGHVLVRSRTEENWYVLEVSDSGRGMTPAQLEAVRQGTTRQGDISVDDISAGTGIGLSLVADLMRAINGHWEIDSPDNIGVRVRIFISLNHQPIL